MTATKHHPAKQSIAELIALGDLRVWSVIITIFGDAVRPRGGVVSASTLAAITERLGLRPEALRVALFRLAKDGWVTRKKIGRNSFYGLSNKGLGEFHPATRRIYAEKPALSAPWRLIGLPNLPETERAVLDQKLNQSGYARLSANIFLGGNTAAKPPANTISLAGEELTLPAWAKSAIAPAALMQDYASLGKTLGHIQSSLPNLKTSDPLDQVALRVLVIHQWRRLLLRHADLPLDVMPSGWKGETCRQLVLSLHSGLSVQADAWLDAAISTRDPAAI